MIFSSGLNACDICYVYIWYDVTIVNANVGIKVRIIVWPAMT